MISVLQIVDGQLHAGAEAIPLTPKERVVLVALAEAGGQPVSAERLIEIGWGSQPVGSESLHRCISTLRTKLSAHAGRNAIVNVYGEGYRLDGRLAKLAIQPPIAEAPELLRQAMEVLGRRSRPEYELVRARLARLRATHPDYLPGHIFAAHTEIAVASNAFELPLECGARAIAIADHILRQQPRSGDGLAVRGFVTAVIEGQHGGMDELDEAILVEPRNWLARYYRGLALAGRGLWSEALADFECAWALTHVSVGLVPMFAYVLHCSGEHDRALAMLRDVQEFTRLSPAVNAAHAIVASWAGHHDEAIAAGLRAVEVPQVSATVSSSFAFALARAGRMEEARKALSRIEAEAAPIGSSMVAPVWLAIGEARRAEDELRRADRDHCMFRHLQCHDPRLKGLRPSRRRSCS